MFFRNISSFSQIGIALEEEYEHLISVCTLRNVKKEKSLKNGFNGIKTYFLFCLVLELSGQKYVEQLIRDNN